MTAVNHDLGARHIGARVRSEQQQRTIEIVIAAEATCGYARLKFVSRFAFRKC